MKLSRIRSELMIVYRKIKWKVLKIKTTIPYDQPGNMKNPEMYKLG